MTVCLPQVDLYGADAADLFILFATYREFEDSFICSNIFVRLVAS